MSSADKVYDQVGPRELERILVRELRDFTERGIVLRVCCLVSGTNVAHAATRLVCSYLFATECPVLRRIRWYQAPPLLWPSRWSTALQVPCRSTRQKLWYKTYRTAAYCSLYKTTTTPGTLAEPFLLGKRLLSHHHQQQLLLTGA